MCTEHETVTGHNTAQLVTGKGSRDENVSMRNIFYARKTGLSMAALFVCRATHRLSPGIVFTRTSLPPAVPRSWCIHQKLLTSTAHERDTPSENEAPARKEELSRRIFEIVGREFEIQKPAVLSKVCVPCPLHSRERTKRPCYIHPTRGISLGPEHATVAVSELPKAVYSSGFTQFGVIFGP